jgi:hypothetical protein
MVVDEVIVASLFVVLYPRLALGLVIQLLMPSVPLWNKEYVLPCFSTKIMYVVRRVSAPSVRVFNWKILLGDITILTL